MTQKISRYLKWLLPVLFILYYSNITVFLHAHINGDEVIVHSHPFSKSGEGAKHHHSSDEILLIHNLSTIHASDGAVHALRLQLFTGELKEIIASSLYHNYFTLLAEDHRLRAPPFIG